MNKKAKYLLLSLTLCLLAVSALWFFSPSPSREYVYQCAELSSSGEVIGQCELSFTAAIQECGRKQDQLELLSIEIPGENILDTFPAAFIWEEANHWWVSLPAVDQDTARTYTLDIAISTDGSFCLIRYCNRRFVGSLDGDFDPAGILPIFADRLEDFFAYLDPALGS